MKRKFMLLIIILFFCATNVNASKFKFIFNNKALPAFNTQEEKNIYCDTLNHWSNYSAVSLFNKGIFTGMKIGQNYYFVPEETITRGEFLLYLNALLNLPESKDASLPFADAYLLPNEQINTIKSMYKMGYVNGSEEKGKLYFNGDEKISRLECALIINNILNAPLTQGEAKYYDSYLIPEYAKNAVKNVTDYGIMQGYEDQSFRPYVKITRAMLADILCKLTPINN